MKRTLLLAALAVSVAAPAAADVWSWRGDARNYAPQYPSQYAATRAPAYAQPAAQVAACDGGAPISTAYARPCAPRGPVWGGGGLSFNNVVAHYERWLNHFEGQIRAGEMDGRLTRAEARRARTRQQEIARLLGAARMDNQIGHSENQRLGQAVERQARRLQQMAGNHRRMYGDSAPASVRRPPMYLGQHRFNFGGAPAPASAISFNLGGPRAPARAIPIRAVSITATPASAVTAAVAESDSGPEKWLNW